MTPADTGPEVTAHQHEVLLQAPGSVVSGKATNPRATGDSASHQRLPCTLAHADSSAPPVIYSADSYQIGKFAHFNRSSFDHLVIAVRVCRLDWCIHQRVSIRI